MVPNEFAAEFAEKIRKIGRIQGRTFTQEEIRDWWEALGPLGSDALAVIDNLLTERTEFLAIAGVVKEVRRLRAARVARATTPMTPPDLDISDAATYLRWINEWTRLTSDGATPEDAEAGAAAAARATPPR